MNNYRQKSPDLGGTSRLTEQYDDSALEGVAANIKLLLKLIQDHKDACQTQRNDGRRMLRVAGMMTILDMVRTRIQKCQSFGKQKAELRRCNTDLRLNPNPNPNPGPGTSHNNRDRRFPMPDSVVDEKERLRRELNASLAARKSLEIMCSSLGKEKEIMAGELAKKVHELAEMEEHINDLKAQNETLLEKVQECAQVHKTGEREMEGNAALQARNEALSEQLLRSLDGYRSMKRKLRELQEENITMQATMEEMGAKVGASLEKIRSYRQHLTTESDEILDIEEGISELEHMFECFDLNDGKHGKKGGECAQSNSEISAFKPVLA